MYFLDVKGVAYTEEQRLHVQQVRNIEGLLMKVYWRPAIITCLAMSTSFALKRFTLTWTLAAFTLSVAVTFLPKMGKLSVSGKTWQTLYRQVL